MTDSNYKIRLVNDKDFDHLQIIKPSIDEKSFENKLQMQKNNKAVTLVLEIEKVPIAFVTLKWIGKPTHPEYPDIEDLYTEADQRGKGYATLLMKECERLVKEKGFNKIGLAVNPDKRCVEHILYSKLGYKELNEPIYVDGIYNGVKDWVIDMEKEL